MSGGLLNSTDSEEARGFFLIITASASRRWLPRRLEHIELVDHSTARRRMRLDIDVSSLQGMTTSGQLPVGPDGVLVSLAAIDRRSHTSFQVFNADGQPMARLVKGEERRLVVAGLQYAASRSVAGDLDHCVAEAIKVLATEKAGTLQARDVLRLHAQGLVLLENEQFMSLLNLAVNNYFLVVSIPEAESQRQVVFYEQEETLNATGSGFKDFWGSFHRTAMRCISPKRSLLGRVEITFKCPTATDCESYHIEVSAPTDLQISSGTMTLTRLKVNSREIEEQEDLCNQDVVPNMAHGYVDNTSGTEIKCASFRVNFRHMPLGIVRTAPFSASLTTVVLGILFWASVVSDGHRVTADLQTSTGLLLLFPALLGAVIVQPDSHTLTAQAIFPTRALLSLVSLVPWAMGLPLLAAWSGERMLATTLVAALACALATAVLTAQLASLRRLSVTENTQSA